MAVLAQEILLSRIKAEFIAVHNPLLLAQGSTLEVLVALKPQGLALTKQMAVSDVENLPISAVLPLIEQIKLLIYSESPLPYSLQENYLRYLQEKHTMGSLVSSGNIEVEFLIGKAGSVQSGEDISKNGNQIVSVVPPPAPSVAQEPQTTSSRESILIQLEKPDPINAETALILGFTLLGLFYGKRHAASWYGKYLAQRNHNKYRKLCTQTVKRSLRGILPEKRREIMAVSKTPLFARYLSERLQIISRTGFASGSSLGLQQELTFLIGLNPRLLDEPMMAGSKAAIAILAKSLLLQSAARKNASPPELENVLSKIFELGRYHQEAKTMTGSFKARKSFGRHLHKMIPNEAIALTTWLLPTAEAKRMIKHFPRQRRQAIEKQLLRVQQISTDNFTNSWSSATQQYLHLSRQLISESSRSEPIPVGTKAHNDTKIPTLEL